MSVLVYNTDTLRPSTLPARCSTSPTRRGRASSSIAPGETDLLPVIDLGRARYGEAATLSWLQGIKANAGSNILPRQRVARRRRQPGQVELALIDHYYWYRQHVQVGAGGLHSALAFFAPARSTATSSTSPAPPCSKSRKHQTEAQQFLAFLVSAGRADHRSDQRQLRVPARPRRPPRVPPDPRRCNPSPFSVDASSATARAR